jgi:hypothetical protein
LTSSIIVTGCDAAHFELAIDLVTSLRDARGSAVTIGFIHVGEEALPPALASAVDHVARVADDEFRAAPRKGYRLSYLGVKTRIPEFFPGFDTYIWLDGDTWVQNPVALDHLLHCAGLADICMHPERDPNYLGHDYARDHMRNVYGSIYGPEEAEHYSNFPGLNAGVFAARASSPIWGLWAQALADVRERARGRDEVYFSDQIPLHRVIMSGRASVHPLRAVNNWLVGLSTPALNLERKRLLAPSFPFEEINIVHLVAASKYTQYRLAGDGRSITFRYRDIKALFHG